MFELETLTLYADTVYLCLSAAISLVGSVLLLKLLCRVKNAAGHAKYHWITVSGILGGCVNWTAHYAALVGLDRNLAHSFDPNMTVAALFASIFMMGASVFVFGSKIRHAVVLGGSMIGLSITLTHHVAMASYYVQAVIVPNSAVLMLIAFGACVLGGSAAYLVEGGNTQRVRLVCIMCMIACMGLSHYGDVVSTTYLPDERVAVPLVFVSDDVMLLSVTTVLGLLVIAGWSIYLIDKQSRLDSMMQVERLEAHDTLTGLPNRRGVRSELSDVLRRAARDGSPVAVMCFNLRRFRNVNDVHGYAAGDGVLVALANRLTRQLQGTAMIGRIAGDEFVAVLESPHTTEDVVTLARRIFNIVSQPVVWDGTPISVATNVGIAMYPHDGDSPDILLSKASLALERTRSREREGVLFYDLKRDEATRTKSALALELKDAMSRGELELYYQRQNSSDTRELIGFEVLLRWNHPTRGLVSPSEFIPIAEAYGYIPMIGEWVLRKACEEAAGWTHPFRIAVNVAADQLCNPRLPDIVASALATSKLAPERLELEMTETGIIADPERALAIIHQLKDMGVKLAMDDYGTGSSSLSTLQSYPFDKIKIDRSFVTSVSTNPQAAAIVHSTVILGRSLNIAILAEGVETEGTLLTLRRLGCTEVQGFLFGRPMPAREIAEIAA